MNLATKVCQNCKNNFTIEPEDFEFYEKIKVPSPTFCPECRMTRRMCFRNERHLYKRKCDATDKDILSIFSPDKPYKVYEQKYWWSDAWDPMEYGRNYDFNKPFFEQFFELQKAVPQISLSNTNVVDSEFCNQTANLKNCYLIFGSTESENCLYGKRFIRSKDSVDCHEIEDSELCYENIAGKKNYKVIDSLNSQNCIESNFIDNCKNCSDCSLSANLKNKKYHIWNIPLQKDEYDKKIKDLNLGSFTQYQKIAEEFRKFRLSFPVKYRSDIQSNDSSGDFLFHCNRAIEGFNCFETENCKYMLDAWFTKDSMDCFAIYGPAEKNYELMSSGYGASNVKFSYDTYPATDVSYSYNCVSSHNLFGCIGLRNKQYCILNKQYTKEEYEKFVPKIIQHMSDMPYIDKKGRIYRFGEFFPLELSPFCYNETIAQEYFPLTKEQVLEQGYKWKEPESRNFQFLIPNSQLPDNIKDTQDDIVGKVIQCQSASQIRANDPRESHNDQLLSACTEAFKIIPQELAFYRKMNLPLPRLCPNCRHYQRLKQRNPLKLWKRKCQCAGETNDERQTTNSKYKNTAKHFHGDNPCSNEFETTYSPERKEIVYCEQCYNSEVA